MLTAWLLQHPAAPLALWWALGAGWVGRHSTGLRARAVVLLWGAAAVAGVAAALDWIVSVPPVVDPFGMTLDGAWWVACSGLVLSTRRHTRPPSLWGLLPLLGAGWLGGGALATCVVVGATASLEPGRVGRGALAVGLVALTAASWLERDDLAVWMWLGTWGAGGELGSLLITAAMALTTGLGVGAVARALELRLRSPPHATDGGWQTP